ncbi:MAG: peptidase C1 [Flavobacteriales bacterium]|nr:peptidase C1 [Flavobacteriales bacterium]MCB9194052.1 peptidase C1 [Flavobacteriales bacterium]
MPIRMTPDEGNDANSRPSRPLRRSGGGTGMAGGSSLIPLLLGFLIKRPKLLLVVVIGFGLFYFLGGMKSCSQGGGGDMIAQLAAFTTGANFDPALYDSVAVYEPLADNVHHPLPERVSLEQFAPTAGDQGQQGSCVAWASAYAARTIVQAEATKEDPDRVRFSPSFLYNQIKIPNSGCQGSYIERAMQAMHNGGVLPFSRFAYDDRSCTHLPNSDERQQALPYRIKGFQRLTQGDTQEDAVDMVAMKQQLAQGSPCVIGMMVGGSFMQDMEGREKWEPTQTDYRMPGFGGHAMCVIGYDDYKFGNEGGFLLQNSWTPAWGSNGRAWVRYSDFAHFCKESYAVYPQGEGVDVKPDRFDIRFGLVEVDAKGRTSGSHIALRRSGDRLFRTVSPVAKGSRFKIEVTNNSECYIYLFGQESDGSDYVLFPYTPKHSPYCGITGTRVFPHDQSLTADTIGTRDVMAIVVFDQPIDFNKINTELNASGAQGLEVRLSDVLDNELVPADRVDYREGDTFGASCSLAPGQNAIAMVIEIDKR